MAASTKSYIKYELSGTSRSQFPFDFPYFNVSDITVELPPNYTGTYTINASTNTVELSSPISVGTVLIRRHTPQAVKHIFANMMRFNFKAVDENFKQCLYWFQEALDSIDFTSAGATATRINEVETEAASWVAAEAAARNNAISNERVAWQQGDTSLAQQLTTTLAASTGAALIGFLQSGVGALKRSLYDRARETISVKDFGAKGDGVTDDYAAIQAATTAAAGKKLAFPSGSDVYIVSAGISVPSNTIIDLGGNTICQKASANTSNGLFFIGSGTFNVVIENGTIDVNSANQGYTAAKTDSGRGVFIYSASSVFVRRVRFINPYGSMILAAASSSVYVDQCDINDANGTGTNAIMFNACTSCDVTRCTGSGKLGVTGYGVFATGVCSKIRALDNTLTYWQIVFSGADYITSGGSSAMTYCVIAGNTLIEPSADTSIHFGIYGKVCNNIIVNSHDVGISIDFSMHTTCNGNVIRTTNASGIVIAGCAYCTVVGNMISNPGSQWILPVTPGLRCGIWGPNSPTGSAPYQIPSGNVITGNILRDDLGAHQMYYGVSLYDSSSNVNVVRGNSITGAVSASYSVPPQTNVGELETVKAPALTNSWANYGASYANSGYSRTEDGVVSLRGMVSSGTVGAVIFTLPMGYRPVNQLVFTVITSSGIGRLDIFPNGDVALASGGNEYVSISGISFVTR